MEALVFISGFIGLFVLCFALALWARLWSTLGMHRQAMHALHQELSQRSLDRRSGRARGLAAEQSSSVPPQSSPPARWSLPGDGQ
jgi:hypothetical protein